MSSSFGNISTGMSASGGMSGSGFSSSMSRSGMHSMSGSISSSMRSAGGDRDDYEYAKKKYGRDGKPCEIYANFFPLRVNCKKFIFIILKFNCTISLKIKKIKMFHKEIVWCFKKKMIKGSNFAIFERFINENNTLFSSEPIFDGNRNLYSKTKINLPDGKITVQVKQKIPEKKFPKTFDVTLTTPNNNELDMSILNEKNVRFVEQQIQALDIILSYGPKKTKLAIGSNLFLRTNDLASLSRDIRENIRFKLGDMKEVSFGHYQSAKLTETGIQLNVDRAAIVFNEGGKLIDIVERFITDYRSGPPKRDAPPPRNIEINNNFRFQRNELELLNKELKNLDFIVNHISYRPMNKIYCLTEKSVSEIFFSQKLENGETKQISVKEYFEKQYADYIDKLGHRLFPNLPCIQVGKINAKYFPFEVVEIVHDQYYSKKLKPKYQSAMTRRCAAQRPSERFEEGKIQARNIITPNNQTDYLKNFEIEMRTEYSKVGGRILQSPDLLLRNNSKTRTQDGQWRNEGGFVIPADDLGSKYILVSFTKDYNNQIRFAPRKDQLEQFSRTLIQVGNANGLKIDRPAQIIENEVYKGREDLQSAFAEYIHDHPDLRLIIFFVPKIDEIYSNIKYLSETKFGIMTQCVSQEKNRQFATPAYVNNLILKINAKLGGTNVQLAPESKLGWLKKKTMIMGLDVTHPARRDRLANSVVGVVGTYDSKMVNYYSKCVVQPRPNLEIVQLDEITKELIENFRLKNKFCPEYILVYRDGVGDGQFKEVLEKEINLMKKAFSDLSPTYRPKVTYIVVQKRHHTRFLAVDRNNRSRSDNVLPGSVVDNGITSNYHSDFYICSHFGAMGTSRPTRYVCLHDDTDFSGDEIQRTTYLLSYLFPRCNKSVSIPPPVLFSHLVAKRARSFLFTLDNNRGQVFGEKELTMEEVRALNEQIKVKESLKNILYFI